jgi:hypothetical protein
MVWAPHLDLHIGEVRRVHSTFISEFFIVEIHKLDIALKLGGSTTQTRKIPAGEIGVS